MTKYDVKYRILSDNVKTEHNNKWILKEHQKVEIQNIEVNVNNRPEEQAKTVRILEHVVLPCNGACCN